MIKKNSLMLLSLTAITFIISGCASSSSNKNVNTTITMSKQNQVNRIIKQNTERSFNEMENQSIVKRKDLQYLRPDPIKIREPKKHLVWSRSDVIKIDNNYLYIIPEGYRYLQEISGEIYIDYEPTKETENLMLDK